MGRLNKQERNDLRELVSVVRSRSKGATALDSANRAGVSLTFTEQQNLKHKLEPVAMDAGENPAIEPFGLSYEESIRRVQNHWNGIPQMSRRDSRLQPGPVSGFYRAKGQPSLDSSVVFDGTEEEQSSMAELKPHSEPHATDDAEIAQLVAELEIPANVSKRATQSTTRNEAGTAQLGQSEYNARHGRQVAQSS